MATTQASLIISRPKEEGARDLGAIGRRFSAIIRHDDGDNESLARCLSHGMDCHAGTELVAVGAPLSPKLIVLGWACLSCSLSDGRRQIIDLYIPGDLIAHSSRPGERSKGSYSFLTEGRYAEARGMTESALSGERSADFVESLRVIEDEFQERLIRHVISAGRMVSHERLASLVLELYQRHERAGLVTAESFAMPLTQEMLGDVLGMSAVHVNRTLQLLRRAQILKTTNGRWQVLDMDRLAAVAAGEHYHLGS